MQTSAFVQHLRLTGLIIGFLLFSFTIIQWFHHATNVEAVQRGPLSHLAAK